MIVITMRSLFTVLWFEAFSTDFRDFTEMKDAVHCPSGLQECFGESAEM